MPTNPAPGIREENKDLQGQLKAFRKHLIHDIEPVDFADIYAQTITYGMFAARLHDSTPCQKTFTRAEAAELIPRSNPFLRKFFQQIVGYDLDERIHWIVDDLADLFRATDVNELMKATAGKPCAPTRSFISMKPSSANTIQKTQKPRRVLHPRTGGGLHRARGG